MPREQENELLAVELGGSGLLESEEFTEERSPDRQYCIFRAEIGRAHV